ncbi:endonuclease domain-containing protein [Phenylobacterium sp. J426]|uniref:endonuclease domain-containing protein n=1 Tax=Phenylobacterium sp. J426 TaxID=2898439 RepID=UPI0021511F21|nr:endonuclease domain-containing protein [Phenylobacterium sp. J426]MCR5876024.1 endonuclease domain-containing protein [Phenylobacterium sp. J426]
MVTAPTARARQLRNNMTEPEVFLWARLKRLDERGYRFRRQRPFREYYLDFVCIDRMLVVEVDGGQHNEPLQVEHGAVRDAQLRRAGYEVALRQLRSSSRDRSSDGHHHPGARSSALAVRQGRGHIRRRSLNEVPPTLTAFGGLSLP